MEIIEQAEAHIYRFLTKVGADTPYISDSGTVDNLMNDGWTPTEIVSGRADLFILDNICWID